MIVTIEVDEGLHQHVVAIGKALYGPAGDSYVGLLRAAVADWHRSPNLSSAATQHMPLRLRKVWTAINQRRTGKTK